MVDGTRRVILSADDFGLDIAVNEAIERAHVEGCLGSASLMVGESAAADAVARAKRLPTLRVGLHVTLVEGTPISLPDKIPDLLGPDGRFRTDMVGSGFRFFFSPRIRRQLETEIRAQFEAFKRTGLTLDHANAHKHIHLHPTVANLILRIGRGFGLKALRIPCEPPAPITAAGGPKDTFAAAALRAWTGQLRAAARRAGVLTNDQVFGLAWSGAMTESRLLALLPHLPVGLSEIYFHPARLTTAALARTMPSYRHAEELAALLSPRVAAALSEAGILRTSFGEIAA